MIEVDIPPVFFGSNWGRYPDGENQLELSQNLIRCSAL